MAELNVSRKNISKLFVDMQNKKFIIPDYQRPYTWDEEKCGVLWEDITNFHESNHDANEYFLGTIVSYKNGQNIEIIDGQQRITSFFLLLRAFYKKLEEMTEDDNVKGLKNQIAPCIWDINPISQIVSDKKKIHIESLVATDEDNEVFHSILETGFSKEDAKDLYSINYRFFYERCKEYAQKNPMQWQPLCVSILQKCIILPIECDQQDTALTIFSTLNDRGMPLSDSDIFKAQLYKTKPTDTEKKDFTNSWKELTSLCNSASISLDDVFRYYSHVLRASQNDKSKEMGLRKFYSYNQYEKLKSSSIMDDVFELGNFWLFVNKDKKSEDIAYDFTLKAKKFFHCLSWYPNEFWRYIVSVYFLKHKNSPDFASSLEIFLENLTAFLYIKFIDKPTVNAIKDDIYTMCIEVQQGKTVNFSVDISEENLKMKIPQFASSKISRAIILLHAYLNESQDDLLPKTFDIEHIFPKKWQNTNYFGWDAKDAQTHLERFGNKVAIEKKLNIQAGNGYFGIKKLKYQQSKIKNVLELGAYGSNDWTQDDIEKREDAFLEDMLNFFNSVLGCV